MQAMIRALHQKLAGLDPRLRAASLLLAIVLAYVVPRLVAYSGVQQIAGLHFDDMFDHLSNMDRLHQLGRLSAEHLAHPFFQRHADMLQFNAEGWPPVVYLLTSFWYGHLDPLSLWVVQLTNGLFTLVLLLGLAGLGHAMGSLRAGLWAGLFAVLSPPLAGATWFYGLDYPLTAMTVMGLWLLWRTREFTCLHACVALGAWSGLGLGVKSAYPLYLAVPAIWLWIRGLRRPGQRARVVGLSLLALAAALGAAYGVRDMPLARLLDSLLDHGLTTRAGLPAAFTPWTLDWLVALPKFILSSYPAPLFLVALPGLVLLHRGGSAALAQDVRGALLGAWWGSLVLLQVMANKMERYLHPVYPLLCLLTAWWFATRLPRRWRTAALAGLAVAHAAVLVTVHLYPTPWLPRSEAFSSSPFLYDLRPVGHQALADLRSPSRARMTDALVAGIVRLARMDPQRRPMGITASLDQATTPPFQVEFVSMKASRVLGDRFVMADNGTTRILPPAVAWIRREGTMPRPVSPSFKVIDTHPVMLTGGRVVVELYLAEGAGGEFFAQESPPASTPDAAP